MKLNPKQTAFLFPGQGSQSVGMGSGLSTTYKVAQDTFIYADQILGFPFTEIARLGPPEKLNDTQNTQPALMIHSVAALRVFDEVFPGFAPNYVAGHSMGELSALVASDALDFENALRLVRTRGESMKSADEIAPGGMAAIIGLKIPALEDICLQASEGEEIVLVANDNCRGQVVISGSTPALARAMELSRTAGARLTKKLDISIAAHSPLMESAQERYAAAVSSAPLSAPAIPIIGNVHAVPMHNQQEIRADLQAQLTSRVRWTESIQYMIGQGIINFIEIGTGSVLIGLLKRIDRSVNGFRFGEPGDIAQFT